MSLCKLDVNKNIHRLLYLIITVIFSILLIIFTAIVNFNFNNSLISFTSVLNNWDEPPINDLYFADSYTNLCDENDISIFEYIWPGTNEGCECQNGTIITGVCCSDGTLDESCCYGTPINQINSRTFSYWDMNANSNISISRKICAKVLQGYSFKKNSYYKDCPNEYKRCGSQSSTQYMFCVPKDTKCPIQKIRFEKEIINDQSYEFANLNLPSGAYYVYVLRNSDDKQPLIKFRVGNDNEVCEDEQETFIPEINYILDKRSNNCTISTRSYQSTNLYISEEDYYSINQITMEVKKLPYFNYNKYPFRLLQQGYINISEQCKLSIDQYYDNQTKMDFISTFAKITFILCLIYAIELIGLESWIGLIYNKYLWGIIILRKKVNILWKILYGLKLLLSLACIISTIILCYYYNSQYDYFQNQIEQKCFEDEVEAQFESIKNNMKPGLITCVIIFLGILFFIEPNICYILITCYDPSKYTKYAKQNKYQIEANNFKSMQNVISNNINNNNNQNVPQIIIYHQGPNTLASQSTNPNSHIQQNSMPIMPNQLMQLNLPSNFFPIQQNVNQISSNQLPQFIQLNSQNQYNEMQQLNPSMPIISQNISIPGSNAQLPSIDILQNNQLIPQQQQQQQQKQNIELIPIDEKQEFQTKPV